MDGVADDQPALIHSLWFMEKTLQILNALEHDGVLGRHDLETQWKQWKP